MFSERRRCLFLLLLLVCCAVGFAQGETIAVLTEQEAVWEPGGSVVYIGSFQLEKDIPDAVWHAELKTSDPEKYGEVVFTRIHEDSIRKRKQSDTMTADAVSGENSFEITWYLPQQISILQETEISFRLEDGTGETIASGVTVRNTTEEGSQDRAITLLNETNRMMMILLIAAGVIWVFAALRIILVRKRHGLGKTD